MARTDVRQQRVGTRQGLAVYGSGVLSLDEAQAISAVCDGLILAGKKGHVLAGELRKHGYSGSLGVDPGDYVAEESDQGELAFEIDEVERQVVVQPSYLLANASVCTPAGDHRTLHSEIQNGESFCERAIAGGRAALLTLAIDEQWLTDHLSNLKVALKTIEHPVALVLSSQNDPLGRKGAVNGLIEIIRGHPDVSLLRTDIGGFGALAYGAGLGAIGLSTTLRHAVPPDKAAGGSRGDGSLRVIHRELLTFFKGSVLFRIGYSRELVECWCPVCDGQSLSRFQETHRRAEANLHNVHVWKAIADELLALEPDRRPAAWQQLCTSAVQLEKELPARTKTTSLEVSAQVRRWSEAPI